MKLFLLFVALALCVALSVADNEDVGPEATKAPGKSLEDFQKMTVKTLKGILKNKGLECKGCSEKAEFAAKVYESQDVPDQVMKIEPGGELPPGVDQEKMDELMAKLKMGGFGNSKMFSANDLKNMSPEELSDQLGDKGKSSKGKKPKSGSSKKGSKKEKSKSKGKGKSSSSSSSSSKKSAPKVEAQVDEDGETIEL
jgi:hypothetical protein